MNSISEPESLVGFIRSLKARGLSQTEIQSQYNHFLEMKARSFGIPLHGSFELTPLCNLDCKMCYVHLDSSRFDRKDLVPVDVWKGLMKEAHASGMLKATLTGGECLTYDGFDELYLFLWNMGIAPVVLSNGLLIDGERAAFFKRYPPSLIQITVYGGSDDAYERVTGHRVFNRVYGNLELIREANLPVFITITPSRFMEGDLRLMIEAVSRLGIPYNINASLVTPRKNTGRAREDLSLDQYIELYRIRKELNHETAEEIDLKELPDESREGIKTVGFQCGGGRSSFVIKYDGTMSPCPSMDEISSSPLETGFQEAWRQINETVRNYMMPQECGDCVYSDRCLICPAMHKNAPVSGHCDPRICERTKKLVSAGFIPAPE